MRDKFVLMNKVPSRKWIIIFISSVILISILLAILPYGIRYGIRKTLIESGAEQAIIEDVDFNPFVGKIAVHNLKVLEGDTTLLHIPELAVRFSWTQLFKKRIYIKQFDAQNVIISIERPGDDILRIGGLTLPASGERQVDKENSSPWGIGLERLEVTGSRIIFIHPLLRVVTNISNMKLSGIESWNPGSYAKFDFVGRVNEGNLRLNSRLALFSSEPWLESTIDLKGLSVTPFSEIMEPDVTVFNGRINVKSRLKINQYAGSGISATHKGEIMLEDTGINYDFVKIQNDRFILNGEAGYRENDGFDTVNFNGDMNLHNLSVDAPDRKIKLMGLHSLSSQNIVVQGLQNIAISIVEANGFISGKRLNEDQKADQSINQPLTNVASVKLSDIRFQELNELSIQSVGLQNAEALLRRDSDKNWHLIEDIVKVIPQEEKEKGKEEGSPFAVKITDFLVTGNSFLRFEDEGVAPPYRMALKIDKFQLQNIDSKKPDQESPLTFEGRIGDYTSIYLSGNMLPFSERLTFNLSGKIEEFDLPVLSSYTSGYVGYDLQSGHLNADINLQIAEGEMDGINELVVRNLKVKPQDEDRIKQLTTELTIPLDSALSLLRDKDNSIQLKLPVHGDISDPKIGIGDIVNKALASALKKAAMTYLKLSFQPFGTFITIVELAGKAARVRLDPVSFEPGSEDLSPVALDYLEKVANILKERPQIELSLCGKTVNGDITALKEQALEQGKIEEPEVLQTETEGNSQEETLEEPQPPEITEGQMTALAKDRATIIKDILVNQFDIETKRIFICNPEIDRDEKARPRVELLI